MDSGNFKCRAFFDSLKGKSVTFCGIGRSHMPLMALFKSKGAVVSARDRRTGKSCRRWGYPSIWGKRISKAWTRTSSSAPRA